MPNPWDAVQQIEGLKELNWILEEKLRKAESREACLRIFQNQVMRLLEEDIPAAAIRKLERLIKQNTETR